jgi:hypothetical protein
MDATWVGSVSDQKAWLDTVGPLGTWFDVYEDFDGYGSGVYKRSNPDPWTKRRIHGGNMIESGNGGHYRNFEMLATVGGGGMVQHWWRENDAGGFPLAHGVRALRRRRSGLSDADRRADRAPHRPQAAALLARRRRLARGSRHRECLSWS